MKHWLRFNLVGILGMAVQLLALAILSRIFPRHPLCTSALAVELTLLHNVTWHMHYTWRDRVNETSRGQQLLRFHLSNGIISLLGNLALMRFLIHHTHLPLLVANILALLTCSLANFYASHHWTFARSPRKSTTAPARICGPAPSSSGCA